MDVNQPVAVGLTTDRTHSRPPAWLGRVGVLAVGSLARLNDAVPGDGEQPSSTVAEFVPILCLPEELLWETLEVVGQLPHPTSLHR